MYIDRDTPKSKNIMNIPSVCNELAWRRGGHLINWEWHLITTREFGKSFLCLRLPVILKIADLSYFDRG